MVMLKQSTAVDLVMGPLLDDTDGKTAETGLTIAQADVRLSKNAAAFAQKNDATSATHLENGYYKVPLNTTDTGTLGLLKVAIAEGGALPVWETFEIITADAYDALFSTGAMPSNVRQISGDATAADNAESFFDGTGYAGTNNVIPLVTTVTNLTNSATTGDFTATQKTSVQTAAAAALTAYDPPTKAEMDARTLAAADYATATNLATVDTVVDTIAAGLIVVDGLVDTLIAQLTASRAEPSAGAPPASATLGAKVDWLYAMARNKQVTTPTERTLFADDATTPIAESTHSDASSTLTRNEWTAP